MIVLGIDPGLNKTGWSILQLYQNKYSILSSGLIKTNPKDDMGDRLKILFHGIQNVINLYNPSQAAIEEVFINKNALSSLKLGHARGALMVAVSSLNIPAFEYSANLVKKTVVGTGHADKHQVSAMIKYLIPTAKCASEDEFDASAIAICHVHHIKSKIGVKNVC